MSPRRAPNTYSRFNLTDEYDSPDAAMFIVAFVAMVCIQPPTREAKVD